MLLIIPLSLQSQEYFISKTDKEIKIDGFQNIEEWDEALVIVLKYEVEPSENIPASAKTICYLTYNNGNHEYLLTKKDHTFFTKIGYAFQK